MFQNFNQIPLDPIFQLLAEYNADKNPHKVNLGIGLYADDQGSPFVLNIIRTAFAQVDTNNFDYQPIGGNKNYLEATAKLIFNNPDPAQIAMQATCGGTQALRIFADLVEQEAKQEGYAPSLLIGMPTWSNHLAIYKNFEIQKFQHLNDNGYASLENLKAILENAPQKSVLLLHGGKTHNPTGQNLTPKQLKSVTQQINEKQIKVLMDSAYFGFGDTFKNEQKYLTELFSQIDNFAVAFSYSKNASLYEHRTGALFVKTTNKQSVESQLQQVARESVSMAPGLGQEIMLNILTNHLSGWEQEVTQVKETINDRKLSLLNMLPSQFDYLKSCSGMFGILPFTPEQIQLLRKHSIYLPNNARINFAGINPSNLDYLIEKFSLF